MLERTAARGFLLNKVYFCNPQSLWQHGTNGNTNLVRRQYFPRGTDRISKCQLPPTPEHS